MVLQHLVQSRTENPTDWPPSSDVDLIKEYAGVMLRCGEIDLSYLVTGKYFADSLQLFANVLENVNSHELNQ